MRTPHNQLYRPGRLDRRTFVALGLASAAGLAGHARRRSGASAATVMQETPQAGTIEQWNLETIRQRAGSIQVDTKAEVAQIVPLDYAGQLAYWDVGPNQASPEIDREMEATFWEAWQETYPNIRVDYQNLDYNSMLDTARTSAEGGAAPDVAGMSNAWAPELIAAGYFSEIRLEEFGFSRDQFWEGALKSVTWDGKLYGVPTNNETMAFIWNKQIFAEAGLDPEAPPATWADVVAYSKQIKEETGRNGYGLVARVNAGNTPYRFMPVLWAYGSGALDEAEPNPTHQASLINNEGGIAALQLFHDMYVTDRSVPTSALTNTQTENGDLFFSGEIAMMISHPSEYAAMRDRAADATGSDKARAEEIVANMAYGLIPEGPVRRAVVFGGDNIHIFNDEATGHTVDREAARAFIAFTAGAEWSTRLEWSGSNPGNLRGFETSWMKERLEQIPFLDVTTSMLPYGIPFPVIPERTQIVNTIIPEMLQNALTGSMSVEDAANEAAERINALIADRSS
jgi:multiple sugar transport system substrate-binding protein